MKKDLLLLLFMLAFSIATYAQNQKGRTKILKETNVKVLKEKAQQFKKQARLEKQKAIEMAKARGWTIRKVKDDGTIIELQRVENGQPVYYKTYNFTAAQTISTDEVWQGGDAGLDLSGDGFTAAVWDGGGVLTTHQEFESRVSQEDGDGSSSEHPTHVTGTVGAAGVEEEAKGMAYEATLHAYNWNYDDSEMSAAASDGLLVSNHSYGPLAGYEYNNGWQWYGDASISSEEDYKFGFYTQAAAAWDDIMHDAPYYQVVVAAGNDSGQGPGNGDHPDDGEADNGYDCLAGKGIAKNAIAVGNVLDIPGGYESPSDVEANTSSSFGPADDGRVKPDIASNGTQVYSPVSASDEAYASYSGTSMAAPTVTGSLLLLQEHYYENYNAFMRAATLRGLMIHTADEAGAHKGPDYKFGWGLMNTQKAAKVISDNQVNAYIREETLDQGDTYEFQVFSEGNTPLRVTLAWTDPAGTPVSPQLDPTDPMLVNDLDMTVTDPSKDIHEPYMLDPQNPAEDATTGDNDVDNVEHIEIENPQTGVYTIAISNEGSLEGGTQDFSLIVSEIVASSPRMFMAQAKTPTSIKLSWNLNLDEDSVLLAYSENNDIGVVSQGQTFTPGDSIGGGEVLYVGADTAFIHTGLNSGTMYHYKAWSMDADHNYSVAVADSTRTKHDLIFTDDFESDKGWSLTGEFERKAPQGLGGTDGNPDPEQAFLGSHVLGTDLTGLGGTGGNPEGDYAGNLSDRQYKATSPLINCKNSSGTYLQFQRWLNVEAPEYDSVQVDVSNNGGQSWHCIFYNEQEINETNWNKQEIDISEYADGNDSVQIRFTVGETDLGGFYSGWNIDDIRIFGKIPRHSITYRITDGSAPIEHAFVECNGQTAFSDSQGMITFPEVQEGTREYIIRKPGYSNVIDTLQVTGTDTVEVTMSEGTAGFEVAIAVINGQAMLPGVTVDFNNQTLTTDEEGQALFTDVPVGEHSFTLTNNNHQQSGTINVVDSNVDTSVYLTYTVEFVVDDEESAIENAQVSLQGYGDTLTNASGKAVFEGVRAALDIPYEISAEGFDDTTGTVDVTEADVSTHISLEPSNVVAFTITGDDDAAIDSARIAIQDQDTVFTDEGGNASLYLPGGSYYYEVTAEGYYPFSDSLSVTAADTSLNVILRKAYNVTLTITDSQQALPDATVNFAGESFTTDAQGQVSIDTLKGDYTYSVSKEGYMDTEGSVSITDSDVQKEVTLQRINTINFVVTDGEDNIENARIDFAGKELFTSAEGEATVDTINGTYAYEVTKTDFQDYSDEVDLYNNDTTITIALTPVSAIFSSSREFSLRTYPNPATHNVHLKGASLQGAVVILRNSMGKQIRREVAGKQTFMVIPVADLPSGLYFIEVQKNGKKHVGKIIIR